MHNLRSAIIFALGMVIFQVITYLIAGIFAQNVLGASVFYPPSPDAHCFLRDPSSPDVQALIIPAQILRGCSLLPCCSRSERPSGTSDGSAAGS